MKGSADCWRQERLDFLDPLSFSLISSRLRELKRGGAGLEQGLVTTCHGPQWQVWIWSGDGADLTQVYDMGRSWGWARGEMTVEA